MIYIQILAVVWIVCGVLTYGVTFAYFWRKFPLLQDEPSELRRDRNFAILTACTGPIGLLTAIFCSDFARYGLKFR